MVPFIQQAFDGTGIDEFFRRIIPVSMDVWLLFFLLPLVLSLAVQTALCFRARKTWVKFLPLILALLIPAAVYVCFFADVLQNIIGGFVSLILIGSAVFIAAGSLVGWLIYALSRPSRRNSRRGAAQRQKTA